MIYVKKIGWLLYMKYQSCSYLLLLIFPQGGPVLYLREMVDAGLKALSATPLSPSIQGRENYCVQAFIEGLFSFTFSKHCASFDEEDCLYFLEVANQQHNFSCQATTQETVTEVGEEPHLYNCTAMNVFKLYLSRILDEAIQEPKVQFHIL